MSAKQNQNFTKSSVRYRPHPYVEDYYLERRRRDFIKEQGESDSGTEPGFVRSAQGVVYISFTKFVSICKKTSSVFGNGNFKLILD